MDTSLKTVRPYLTINYLWLVILIALTVEALFFRKFHIVTIDYLDGAQHWLNRSEMYFSEEFIYPPFAAIVYAPLTFLPLSLAVTLHAALLWLIVFYGATSFHSLYRANNFPNQSSWLLLTLCILLIGYSTLETGQLNALLAATYMLTMVLAYRARWITCGILLGVVTGIKPTVLPLAGVIAILYPRTIIPMVATFILTLLLPFALAPAHYVESSYHSFFKLMIHVSHTATLDLGRWSQIFNVLYQFGLPVSETGSSLIAAMMGLVVLGVALWAKRKLNLSDFLLWLYALLASYQMLFNTRNEGNDYIIFAPAIATALTVSWQKRQYGCFVLYSLIAIGIFANYYFSKLLIPGQTCWFAPLMTVLFVTIALPHLWREFRNPLLTNAKFRENLS